MVLAIDTLFENGLGFKVKEDCYMGPQTATIPVSEENVRFDIFMRQVTEQGSVHYVCECKFRSRRGSNSDLRGHFRVFAQKALKVLDHMLDKYGRDRFCFLFVSTVPFSIWDEDISNLERLQTLLGNFNLGVERLHVLSDHLRIMVVPIWIVETLQSI